MVVTGRWTVTCNVRFSSPETPPANLSRSSCRRISLPPLARRTEDIEGFDYEFGANPGTYFLISIYLRLQII